MFKLFYLSSALACLHVITAVLLYRERVTGQLALAESDVVVFVMPTLIALVGFCAVFWFSGLLRFHRKQRIGVTIGFSLAATGFSFFVFMLLALNLYGG